MGLVPLPLNGFPGGLNTSSDATSLEPNELAEAMNVRIGNQGEVQRRSGYLAWSSGMPYKVHHIHRWIEPDGIQETLAVSLAGDLFVARDDTGVFSSVGNVGAASESDRLRYPIGFADAEDHLYVSTLRASNVFRWDGTDWSLVVEAHVPDEDDEADAPPELVLGEDPTVWVVMPVGQHITYRHGRMYVAHTLEDQSRVWFSDVLDPEAFTAASWVDLDPEDGTTITAMNVYADELFIFKDNSMWEMTGRDPTTYSLRRIDRLRGTVSPKSVCQMRGMLVFFDRDTGIWGYDGAQLTLLSEKINDYIMAGQNYQYAPLAAAYYGDDRLYVTIPWGQELSSRTFVMNAQNGAWSEYDSGFLDAFYNRQDRFQAFYDIDGILKADASKDDIAGVEFESHFRTAWIFPLGPGAKARLRRLEMVVDANQGAEISIDVFREMQQSVPNISRTVQTVYNQVDMDHPGSVRGHHMHTITMDGWGGRHHSVQLRFGLSLLPTQLNRVTLFFSGIEDVRGERR